MNETEILTENLRVVPRTRADTLAFLEGMAPADRAEVSPAWLHLLENAGESDPWVHGFSLRPRNGAGGAGELGACGFKGPPDAEGAVEIAYMVHPEHEGRGFATEAASALVAFASRHRAVRVIRAHTRPESAASARVLTKCGFLRKEDVMDPEDGLVWRWEIAPSAPPP